jgi:hypothetical protein
VSPLVWMWGVALLDIGREEGALLWLADIGSCLENYFSFLELRGVLSRCHPFRGAHVRVTSASVPSVHAVNISCLFPPRCKIRIGPWNLVGGRVRVLPSFDYIYGTIMRTLFAYTLRLGSPLGLFLGLSLGLSRGTYHIEDWIPLSDMGLLL